MSCRVVRPSCSISVVRVWKRCSISGSMDLRRPAIQLPIREPSKAAIARVVANAAKVLIDAANDRVVGLGDHAVVAALGDRTPGGERGQPGAPPGAEPVVDPIPVEDGRRGRPGGDPGGDLPTTSSSRPGQAGEGRRPPDQVIEVVLRHPGVGDGPSSPPAHGAGCRSGRPAGAVSAAPAGERAAHSATSCWARMSSGATGGSMASSRPARTPARSAQHSTRSSRVIGKRRPVGMAPCRCPERPTRCRKVARLRGEAIWQTMSTGPMSMPSSSDAVATRARSSPARSRDSTRLRRSRERLPW